MDQWRYLCPQCHAVSLEQRSYGYWCKNCKAEIGPDERVDVKRERDPRKDHRIEGQA